MQAEGRDQVNGSVSRSHRWGVILAGGDGTRLLPLTRRIAGDDRPKQFCPVLGDETLLNQTQRRISRLIEPWRTLLVLTGTHEPFYADQVAGIPSSRLLIQPSNQGTAPAILYSLLRLREMDPQGVVAFFPSDHHFSDDEAFISHIDSAYAAAAARPEVIVLLGIPPETPEVEYGWIEPGDPLGQPVPDSVSRVTRFWEKPSGTLASQLMERGCLWNSFVMVGYVHAFLHLIRHALPGLLKAFEAIRRSLFTANERAAVRDLYSGIRSTNFSQDVLSIQANGLAVLRATGIGWSDLGEPGRVLSVLERKGVQTDWGVTPGRGDEGMLARKSVAVYEPEEIQRGNTTVTRTQLGRHKRILETRLRELSNTVAKRQNIAVERAPHTQLRFVEAALDRIGAGTYGCCLQCDEEIGMKRLTALPQAVFCIACQESAERSESRWPDVFKELAGIQIGA